MTTDIKIYEGKRPIVMKSKIIHWVREETAELFQRKLQTQDAHKFAIITELGITINTAEIEGVYTMKEYENICKKNQGMWECAFGNWHKKGFDNCTCASERMKRIREEQKKQQDEQNNKPMTEEEQAKATETRTKMTEEAALKGSDIFIGMFRQGGPRMMRRSTIKAWEKVNGPVNPKILERITIDEDILKKQKKDANEVFN